MEIHLPGSNIESLIDAQVNAAKERTARIQNERKQAEETAIVALVRQFQNEVSTYLDTGIQSNLQLQFLQPKEISFLAVCASFTYSNTTVYIRRTLDFWEITYDGQVVTVDGDMLQRQLLNELSRIREKVV